MKYIQPRHAIDVLDELLLAVQPGPGIAIALTERTPDFNSDTNWRASAGAMTQQACDRYRLKLDLLEQEEPRIDWSLVTDRDGDKRRVAKYHSEAVRAAT